MLYAQKRWSLLLVFQAMDAAGKDGSSNYLVNSLQGVEVVLPASMCRICLLVAQSLRANATAARLNKEPLFEQLNRLPQFTVAAQFARISSVSFKTIGLMGVSLYHPYLQGDRFLIVGHSDAKGSREYNLRVSRERADAVSAALINPFGISPSRLVAVGFGKEQLLNEHNPNAAENRHMQLINLGQ